MCGKPEISSLSLHIGVVLSRRPGVDVETNEPVGEDEDDTTAGQQPVQQQQVISLAMNQVPGNFIIAVRFDSVR